jgi:hypothetical protein
MKHQMGTAVLAAAILAAFAGTAAAQNTGTGTESGANTTTPAAGTGNAGDRTAQPGSTPPAKHVRHHRRHHRAKSAASAPSAGQ